MGGAANREAARRHIALMEGNRDEFVIMSGNRDDDTDLRLWCRAHNIDLANNLLVSSASSLSPRHGLEVLKGAFFEACCEGELSVCTKFRALLFVPCSDEACTSVAAENRRSQSTPPEIECKRANICAEIELFAVCAEGHLDSVQWLLAEPLLGAGLDPSRIRNGFGSSLS